MFSKSYFFTQSLILYYTKIEQHWPNITAVHIVGPVLFKNVQDLTKTRDLDKKFVRMPRTQPAYVGKFSVCVVVLIFLFTIQNVNNKIKTTTENLPTQAGCVPGIPTDFWSKSLVFIESCMFLKVTGPLMHEQLINFFKHFFSLYFRKSSEYLERYYVLILKILKNKQTKVYFDCEFQTLISVQFLLSNVEFWRAQHFTKIIDFLLSLWPFWSHWAGLSMSTCFYAVDCYVSWESEFGEKHLTQSYPLPKMMYLTPKSNSIFKWVVLNMSLSHIEFF